mgnify:CR=1 FL=1
MDEPARDLEVAPVRRETGRPERTRTGRYGCGLPIACERRRLPVRNGCSGRGGLCELTTARNVPQDDMKRPAAMAVTARARREQMPDAVERLQRIDLESSGGPAPRSSDGKRGGGTFGSSSAIGRWPMVPRVQAGESGLQPRTSRPVPERVVSPKSFRNPASPPAVTARARVPSRHGGPSAARSTASGSPPPARPRDAGGARSSPGRCGTARASRMRSRRGRCRTRRGTAPPSGVTRPPSGSITTCPRAASASAISTARRPARWSLAGACGAQRGVARPDAHGAAGADAVQRRGQAAHACPAWPRPRARPASDTGAGPGAA